MAESGSDRERLESLFERAEALSVAERARWLDELSTSEPALAREIASLLEFGDPAEARVRTIVDRAVVSASHERHWPRQFGAYRVLRTIGSGGMGTVFEAVREQDYHKRVALKVAASAIGTPAWVDRFQQERQILAGLDHPYIARFLDGGASDEGLPYFAMELVEGEPITDYVRNRDLPIRERIVLFRKVCSAVSYAHQSLVVHRDLKPANILVTDEGEPKLLDFGVAKLQSPLDPTVGLTQTALPMLTPAYCSPEQVLGGKITTRVDVYLLGLVLFEVLTGTQAHRLTGSSPAELQRAICQEPEPVPSERSRVRALRGDLDTIVLKAIQKDPDRRYQSVDELNDDLGRYLDRRPISARKSSWVYRCGKFLRHYWIPSVAAAVAILALITGFLIANRQRAIAQRRFNEVRQLPNRLFEIEAEVRELPGSTKTRQHIAEAALGYLSRLSGEVHGDPGLALELGNAYFQLARLQGVATGRNLGQTDAADQSLRNAESLIESVLAAQPANREAMALAAQVEHDRMILAGQKGGRRDLAHRAEALAFARKATDWLDRFAPGPVDHDAGGALTLYRNIADQYLQGRQPAEALEICQRASILARTLDRQVDLGMFSWVTAEAYQQRGELEEARKAIGESVRLVETHADPRDSGHAVSLAHVLIWQGRIVGADKGVSLGQAQDGMAAFHRAFGIVDPMVHADPNDQSNRVRLAMAGSGMVGILRNSDPGAALQVCEHTLRHLDEMPGNATIQRTQVEVLAATADPLRRLGRNSEARQNLDRAFEILNRLKLYPSAKVVPGSVAFKAICAEADFRGATGDPAGALASYTSLITAMRAGGLDPDSLEDTVDLSNTYQAMSELHRRNQDPEQADRIWTERTALWDSWARKLPGNAFVQRQLAIVPSR